MSVEDTQQPSADDQYDDDEFDDDRELECITCLGEGWVDSVAAETGRYLWDLTALDRAQIVAEADSVKTRSTGD